MTEYLDKVLEAVTAVQAQDGSSRCAELNPQLCNMVEAHCAENITHGKQAVRTVLLKLMSSPKKTPQQPPENSLLV
jgi:hypothetical protein